MSPVPPVASHAAANDFKRESGTARLLGSGKMMRMAFGKTVD